MDERQLRAEHFKSALRAKATGGGMGGLDYVRERAWLLSDFQLKQLTPDFLVKCRTEDEFWEHMKEVSDHYQPRRNYLKEQFDKMLTYLEQGISTPIAQTGVEVFSQEGLKSAWGKALSRMPVDPEGAITSARTMVETTCKHILDNLGLPYTDKEDMPQLYHLVAKGLNLSPDQDIDVVLKQVLQGCSSIASGLAGLRNRIGDSHGQGTKRRRALPRHAELAVNVAGALSIFLYRTHAENAIKVGR